MKGENGIFLFYLIYDQFSSNLVFCEFNFIVLPWVDGKLFVSKIMQYVLLGLIWNQSVCVVVH